MSLWKSFLSAGVLLGMSIITVPANAVTGQVAWYFTQDYSDGQVYTFVNIDSSVICYYIGNNTAYASIFAASQIAGNPVTVSCDTSAKITSVAN
ncbi:MAG: hypothetical protein ABFR65_03875 [Pseudomonadota bacterium]